jgi:PAS domain S-box-containing protein
VLEDSEPDFELIVHALRRDGLEVEAVRVQTEDDFARELARGHDVVLCDFRLPGFDALRALELRDEAGVEVPVIIVSGTVGDEQAAAAIKQGAADYLLKDRMGRLGQAVRGALREQRLILAERRAVEEMRRGEERLRLMVESVQDYAIFLLDEQGRVASWNAGAQRIHGYPEAAALGRDMAELLLPEGAGAPDAERVLAEAREQGRVEEEGWRVRADGERFRANVVLRPLVVDDDAGYLVVVRDVTEQRELEAQLQQSQKMEAVGRLAGGVAHDFNNLLTVITGSAEMLSEDLEPDDPRRVDAEEIRRAAERGAALTRQLLAFTHRQVRRPLVIDLRAVVDEMDGLLARVIGEHIELVTEAPAEPLAVRADPTEIEQVLMNLAVNARDAMPEGGVLSILLDRVEIDRVAAARMGGISPGPYARMRVADTGHGIPPEIVPHLFEPFFTTKGPGEGTGLGLPTVYAIVTQSGGHIGVESRDRSGATFTVHLPLTDAAPTPQADPDAAVGAGHAGSESILLVEDEPAVRRLVSRTLERAGYSVLVAETGAAAAALWSRTPVDLLLTDVVMPGTDGAELARRFSADRPGGRVLFMSGYTQGVLVDRAAREARAPFLQKPFTPAELARRVREVLDAPEARP